MLVEPPARQPIVITHTLLAAENASIFDPASPPAESIRTVSLLVLAVAAFVFVVVEGVLFYSIFRFRHSSAAAGGDEADVEPPQVYGSMPIEVAWTTAPAIIVFILVLATARSLWEVNVPAPPPSENDEALYVTVVGRQWWWEFRYESWDGRKLAFTTANELHVPISEDGTSRPVYLTLLSADVCHSFWVPRLAGKTDLIPGQTNATWFETDESGTFVGQCAEYCGTQHANMLLRVVAQPSDEFETWLADQEKPAFEAGGERVERGRVAFLSNSCLNCHRIRGTTADGTYAPDLTHLMSRKTLAAGTISNTPENLRDWIDDPQQIKTGCLMPAFKLNDRDLDDIVSYLSTLK